MNKQLIFSTLIAGIISTGLATSAQAAVQPGSYQTRVQADTTRIDNTSEDKRHSAPVAGASRMAGTRTQPTIYQDGVQPSTTRRDAPAAPQSHHDEVAINRFNRR